MGAAAPRTALAVVLAAAATTNYDVQTFTRRVALGRGRCRRGQARPTIDAEARLGPLSPRSVSAGRQPSSPAYAFNAGYHADEAADSPEMLDIALDKPSYKAGDTARIKVSSRFAGKALVSVLGGKLQLVQGSRYRRRAAARSRLPCRRTGAPAPMSTVTLFRPLDGDGQAHARSRHGPALAAGRSGRAHAEGRDRRARQGEAGQRRDRAGDARRPRGGRRSARDAGGRRRRHSQSDALRRAETGELVLTASANSASMCATTTAA